MALHEVAGRGGDNARVTLKRNPPEPFQRPFSYERPLGGVRLYLDDLEDLLRVAGAPRTAGATLSAGNAEAETVEDLRDATAKELAKLGLVTREPRIEVRLEKRRASVSTAEDSDSAKALVDDVYRLLAERRSYRLLTTPLLPFMVTGVATGIIIGLLIVFTEPPPQPQRNLADNLVIGFQIIAAIGIIGYSVFTSMRRHWRAGLARLILVRRSERRGVSSDARQKITIAIVTALVVAPVSLLVAVLAGAFKPK